jgi:hypothetical protein
MFWIKPLESASVFKRGTKMAISNSLSEEAINEFASRVSSDPEIPEALKNLLTTLKTEEKWSRDVDVSSALEVLYTNPEGRPE